MHAKVEGPVSMIELKEVETALKDMSRKTSGPTGIVTEMLRTGGKRCL